MTAAWAGLLVAATLKSTLCLALAGLSSLLLWRRSAALRHLVWAVAIAVVLLLPLLQLALPQWAIPVGPVWSWQPAASDRALVATGAPVASAAPATSGVPAASHAGSAQGAAAGSESRREPRDGSSVLVLAWSVGACLALAPLALAFLRIARVARRARPLDDDRWRALADRVAAAQGRAARRLDLRRATEPLTPLTWGVLRPVVILPDSCDSWSEEQAYEVLVHEAGHVRRRDCLTQLLASAACVLYWWNPLVWLAGRQMLAERERACDDQVLLAGARASDYANDLLQLARTFGAAWSTSQVTTAMARRSQIAGRLLAVLDPHLDRAAVGRGSLLAVATLGLVVLLPLASARAVPATAPPASGPIEGPVAAGVSPALAPRAGRPARPIDLDLAGRELHARERAYAAALARGDLDALAAFYTSDAQVAAPSLPTAYGRQNVRALLQHLVDGGVRRGEQRDEELYPVGELLCRLAVVRLTSESGATIAETRTMTLWKNEDGAWRIHRDWATR